MNFRRRFIALTSVLGILISHSCAHSASFSTAWPGSGSMRTAIPLDDCPDPLALSRPIALGAYYFNNGDTAPGNANAVSSFKAQTGRTPAVWMIYQSWTGWNQFPSAQAKRAQHIKSTLMVTWEPWSGKQNDHRWNCQNVVAGRYDNYIRSYARAVRNSGVPVMIRFAHEMNGDWYPWGTAYRGEVSRNNNNSPAMFCAMWKHVVSIFRAQGATNAKWVWSPNILYTNEFNTQSQQEHDLVSMYPGDEWVDWVGVSVYNDGTKRVWRSFSSLFDSTYQALTVLCAKPLMIAEMGVTEQGAPSGQTKASWLQQALLIDIPQRYNRVRMVTYFNRDKSSMGESNYRFDSSPASLAVFRQVANSPLYRGVMH